MKKLLILVFTLSLAACSSTQVKKEVDQELSEVSTSKTIRATMMRNQGIIQRSKYLTKEQKKKLLELQKTTFSRVQTYRTDIIKLKEVLFNNFVNKKYNSKKIDYIAKQIEKVERKRFELMFSSLKQTKTILKGTDLNGTMHDELNQAIFHIDHRY